MNEKEASQYRQLVGADAMLEGFINWADDLDLGEKITLRDLEDLLRNIQTKLLLMEKSLELKEAAI